ncbi:NAD kinase [Rhodoluna sp. KAS3]|uniref:NAD kinase n=1 Tax=Rhodoluna sp. KAS3 TaxID=942880 RepID=UPI0022322096|nr:NAD kinase [Rhodoluna sp. KAS3]BDS48883.1 NAD kinase 2 [Rhodoluna sp. KAS3]
MTARRHVLVVSHTRRDEAISAARETVQQLIAAGITPVMTEQEFVDFQKHSPESGLLDQILKLGVDVDASELELAMVLGGDGTILKAAEIVREDAVPLMGINLGHVGFLAESERDGLSEAVDRVAKRDYLIKERLTLDVRVFVDGVEVYRTWALNEATIEKSARERMLEVVVEVEQHPLSSFGCDGIVISTPTGSTAYAFSAGGPIVWPSVEALLVVPLSAHALFARPLVVKPDALVAVEVLQRSAGHGVLWCDGRRTWELPPGARVEVLKSSKPVRLARLHQSSFTDRLVNKFSLPVAGWRGVDEVSSSKS